MGNQYRRSIWRSTAYKLTKSIKSVTSSFRNNQHYAGSRGYARLASERKFGRQFRRRKQFQLCLPSFLYGDYTENPSEWLCDG